LNVCSVLNLRRRRIESLVVVDNEWQNLVLDLDRLDGVERLQRALGGDHRDLLALVTAVVVEELAGELTSPLIPGNVCARRFAGQNGPDTGHLLGLAGIDLQHLRVSVRAAQDGAVQHFGQRDVVWVDRGSADAFVGVDLRHASADHLGLLPGTRVFGGFRSFRNRSVNVIGGLFVHHTPPFFLAAVDTALTMCG
jgi:hypothetical protein